ncbi:MAG: DUF2085 domain-containing protein [Chloroflexi bacterium]|nr:DUF2085 domain-containing protein [Chloroflexota bacterium]
MQQSIDAPGRSSTELGRPAAVPDQARPYPGDIAPWRRRLDQVLVGGIEDALAWVFRHWLLLANLLVTLALLGAVGAPVLAAARLDAASAAIHTAYLLLCPQRPAHSYFLFGQQLALEQREMAMFGAQFGAGLLYGVLRARGRWRERLSWSLLLLFSLPMAWDGLSQAVGLRDSDWQTRTWTGALFSAAFVFWLYPVLDRQLRLRRGERIAR